MRKLLYVLPAAALLLSLAACGGPGADEAPPDAGPAAGTPDAGPSASQPAATPEAEPGDAAEPVELQALYASLAAQMPEMIALDETMMLNYCGIAAEDCAQAAVAVCQDGLRTDELWLIEAVDEAALGRIRALAENRLKMKGEETVSYAPDQYKVVEDARLITSGLYLALIVSPDADALEESCMSAIGG